jgi:hypothetical protein
MKRDARLMSGILLVTVSTIQYGGYFLLSVSWGVGKYPSASVLNTRTSWDVAIGPWRAIIDLFRMMHGGLGPARGQRSRKGPCASYPTRHFSRLLYC